MQIDQRTLNRLLALNDGQLAAVIEKIASEAGIDPAQLGLDPRNLAQIREALGSANADDLAQLNAVYETYRKNQRK
ncbi:MAG: hypothetical protein IJW30_04000 [Clostridia bacterium]|nr:hypothetical protein [Clostridia bacterium]